MRSNNSNSLFGDRPTVVLSTPSGEVSAPFTVTVTLSNEIITLTQSMISLINGVASSINQSSALIWTFVVTPDDDGLVTVSILENKLHTTRYKGNFSSNVLNVTMGDPPPPGEDYLTNLYDWWVANRGIIVSTDNAYILKWNGYINETITTQLGFPGLRTDGKVTLDGTNDAIGFSLSANPSISGNATFAFRVKKSALRSAPNPLFDGNTHAPRFQAYLEISAANSSIGFEYNNVTYDTNVDFTYDGNYHNVVFVLETTSAKVYLDGVQIGSTFTITGGGLAMNTGQVAYLFRSISSPVAYGLYDCEAVRIYTEALSEDNIDILETGPFSEGPIVDSEDTIFVTIGGQSNVGPPTAANTINNYDVELRNGFPDVYMWNYVSTANKFIPIPGNTDILLGGSYTLNIGPILKIAYDLRQQYPTHNIRIFELYVGATNLITEWAPGTSLRTDWLTRSSNALKSLQVEQRNIIHKSFLWVQGEGDAIALPVPPYASPDEGAVNYYYNLGDPANTTSLIKQVTDTIDPDIFIISALSSRYSTLKGPYRALIRTAQEDFVALDTAIYKLIDTDDPDRFPYDTPDGDDGVHYTAVGLTSIGEDAVNFIIESIG